MGNLSAALIYFLRDGRRLRVQDMMRGCWLPAAKKRVSTDGIGLGQVYRTIFGGCQCPAKYGGFKFGLSPMLTSKVTQHRVLEGAAALEMWLVLRLKLAPEGRQEREHAVVPENMSESDP